MNSVGSELGTHYGHNFRKGKKKKKCPYIPNRNQIWEQKAICSWFWFLFAILGTNLFSFLVHGQKLWPRCVPDLILLIFLTLVLNFGLGVLETFEKCILHEIKRSWGMKLLSLSSKQNLNKIRHNVNEVSGFL